ncbi:MAG: pyoverdine biosynthesis [uncultured bacterium]|nr:MAG: pyoverdine biosynthesis [uncultured bacterium]
MLSFSQKTQLIAEKIMQELFHYRRVINCQHIQQMDCHVLHHMKIKKFIETSQPIHFVLPAFPAKSPNPEKTAGILPDLGERLSLKFLDQLCQDIQSIYPPGAQVCICSDGRVFNDLVNVSDTNVDAYAQEIKNIIRMDNLTNLTTFSLDDFYHLQNYAEMREKLTQIYGEPMVELKEKVKTNTSIKSLFNGIHKFIFEDYLMSSTSLSKNQLRHFTKEITYQVIQRSNAWGNLIKKYFPDAVRLSIHPQPCHSEKFGIMLLQSSNVWATPWHRVLLSIGNKNILIKKKEAIAMGAKPIFINYQFSHYMM